MITRALATVVAIGSLVTFGCGSDGNGGQGLACDTTTNPCDPGASCSSDGTCVPAHDAADSSSADGSSQAYGDDGGGAPQDAGSGDGGSNAGDAGACPDQRPLCGDSCCTSGESCQNNTCADAAECETDEGCQEDSYCYLGQCLGYGTPPRGSTNPECTQLSVAGLFQPAIQCEFVAPPAGDPYPAHTHVLSTPLVTDFDFDNSPDVIAPSLVVMTYNGSDGRSGYYNGGYGVIRVLDGKTCKLQYNVGTQLNGCNTPAIGDLDLDGRPDIVAHTGTGGIRAYRYSAADDAFVDHCAGPLSFGAEATGWAGPSIADLDDDGLPEIQSGGITYDHECNVVDRSLGLTAHMNRGAGYPVLADVDGLLDDDGIPSVEMAVGSALFRFDRLTKLWTTLWSGGALKGYIAVADFGTYTDDPTDDERFQLDGVAEIVIVRAPNVYITTMDGRVVYGPVAMPTGKGGGPPTVGDFDGDGLPEVAATGSAAMTVFDPDCQGLPDLSYCATLRTDGILWWQPSQDLSSNITGSSLFDFEGDGRVEVVYADEVFLRVYDGQSGEVVFSQWHSSCTWNENPIIADVDGDFNAEIVMPSNTNCNTRPRATGAITYPVGPNGFYMDPLFKGLRCEQDSDCASSNCDAGYCRCTSDAECGGTGSGFVCAEPVAGTLGTGNTCRSEWRGSFNGIRVYGDALDRWVSSRTIWSQHAYSITHIDEDGTVRKTSDWIPNWMDDEQNNFRQNTQGAANASSSPDMTGSQGGASDCNSDGSVTLSVRVCNRGTQPVGQDVPVAFYDGAPVAGAVACVGRTPAVIAPGGCLVVECTWATPPGTSNPAQVTVVVDDDGTGFGENTECVEGNNTASISNVGCQIIE